MEKQWHIYSYNMQKGPFSWEDLKAQVAENSLKKEDLVWTEGMEDWDAASNIKDLFPIEASPPPIPPQYQAKPPIPPALREEKLAVPDASTPVNSSITDNRQEQTPKKKSPLKILALVGGGIVVLAVLVMAVILLVAPNLEPPEMAIHDIEISAEITDENLPLNPTNRFSHLTEVIHVTMLIENIPEGMVFNSQWFYEGDPMSEKDSFTLEYVDTNYAASYIVDDFFYPGNYLFELRALEDDRVLAEADFEVFWEHIPIEQLHPNSKIFRTDGFAFAYPQDWSREEGDDILIHKDGLEDLVIFYVIKYDALASEDDYGNILAAAGKTLDNIESFDGILVDIVEDMIFVDGVKYQYLRIFADIPIDGELYYLDEVIIKPEGSNVYSFAYVAHEDHNDTYQNAVANIVNSITFQ